jgi:hypothetical protein
MCSMVARPIVIFDDGTYSTRTFSSAPSEIARLVIAVSMSLRHCSDSICGSLMIARSHVEGGQIPSSFRVNPRPPCAREGEIIRKTYSVTGKS